MMIWLHFADIFMELKKYIGVMEGRRRKRKEEGGALQLRLG